MLITASDAPALYEMVSAVAPLASRYPVRFTGESAALNPLLGLRRDDAPAYQRVLDLIDARRAAQGKPSLQPKPQEGYDKNEYMREFMEAKRQRERRAAEIENMLRSPRDKLIGTARLEFMRQQSAKWKQQRDEYVAKVREARGGKLSKETMQQTLEQFWQGVDEALETRYRAAQVEMLKPVGQRSVLNDLDALESALKNDPYAKK